MVTFIVAKFLSYKLLRTSSQEYFKIYTDIFTFFHMLFHKASEK